MSEPLDAPIAGSSPAVESIPAPSPDLETLSESELREWKRTGAFPEPKVETPPAASSAAPASDPPVSSETPKPPVSETGAARPDPRATENRVPELLADRARERERAERAERELAELRRQQPPPKPDAPPAASSAAPAGLVEPDPEKFTYGTSDPAYVKAVAQYEAAMFVAKERATWEQRQQEARQAEEQQRRIAAFEERAAKARTKHADFDAVALLAPTDIPPGSVTDLWVLEDEAGADILYHLQKSEHAAERRRILALGPREQVKELVRLGDRLTAPPPAASSTNAPPPPATLPTRGSPADEVEAALALGTDDEATRRYMDAENRRQIALLRK